MLAGLVRGGCSWLLEAGGSSCCGQPAHGQEPRRETHPESGRGSTGGRPRAVPGLAERRQRRERIPHGCASPGCRDGGCRSQSTVALQGEAVRPREGGAGCGRSRLLTSGERGFQPLLPSPQLDLHVSCPNPASGSGWGQPCHPLRASLPTDGGSSSNSSVSGWRTWGRLAGAGSWPG